MGRNHAVTEIKLRGPRTRTADLLEDIEWMLTTGETPAGVIRRTGRTARTINRLGYRLGRPDIASQFNSEAARERNNRCPSTTRSPTHPKTE